MDSVQFTLKLIEGRSDSSSRGRMGCRSWPMGSSMYDVHKKIGIFDHPFPPVHMRRQGEELNPLHPCGRDRRPDAVDMKYTTLLNQL